MTPSLIEVEQVSLSASDPLPSLNTPRTGVAAYEGGQDVMLPATRESVNEIFC
jgi:hypothetical protein